MRIVIAEDAAVIGGPGRAGGRLLALMAEGRFGGAIADQLVVTQVTAG